LKKKIEFIYSGVGMVVYAYNLTTQLAEAGGYQIQAQPGQLSKTLFQNKVKKGWGC
jgi:Fe-S cluster biosynthesis and repair protein YggX